jgi:co-chaperonin GroES (HSP10)
MKMKLFAISMVSAALAMSPVSMLAQDKDVEVEVKDKAGEVKDKADDKISELNRKTHEKICQGHHGAVTAKTDMSVTIDGKIYALTADTRVNKQEEPLLLKTVKVGDKVCFTTEKAADGTDQVAKLIAIGDEDKVRVREKEVDVDSPSKVEVETPNKKIEVK